MNVEIVNKSDNDMTFVIDDIDVTTANALRRTMISEVPTLAIDEVSFYQNSSSLYDEIIAHRMGLIPIKTDLKILNFREECKCKDGCPSCTLQFKLKKEGPCTVCSHDLESMDKMMKPVPDIPIVKLGKGQKIELEAIAILGSSKNHAKWQPCVTSYKYYPKIAISDECNACAECIEACPEEILALKKGKLKVLDLKKCSLCKSCVETCRFGAIMVEGIDTKFIFTIEGNGSLKAEEIFIKACEILEDKAKEFKKLL